MEQEIGDFSKERRGRAFGKLHCFRLVDASEDHKPRRGGRPEPHERADGLGGIVSARARCRHLRRAGLARYPETFHPRSFPVPLLNDGHEHRPQQGSGAGGNDAADLVRRGARHGAVGAADFLDQIRLHEHAAVRDRAERRRHLQGRDGNPLSERCGRGKNIARIVKRRERARMLRGQADVQRRAKTETLHYFLESSLAHGLLGKHRAGIDGLGEYARHRLYAVYFIIGILDRFRIERDAADVSVGRVRHDRPKLQCACHGDSFENGPGLPCVGHGLIGEDAHVAHGPVGIRIVPRR